jgi:hypothetical protein
MQFMPRDMLFAVRYPPAEQTKQLDAAKEITQLLETKSGVVVEDFENRQQLMHFAAQA